MLGSMTNEEILKAIIEAQVKGGYKKYEWHTQSDRIAIAQGDGSSVYALGDGDIYPKNTANSMPHDVLRILLDTEGCKAAYGEDMIAHDPTVEDHWRRRWFAISCEIHGAWHSKEGNNWKAAIETAYNLLPCHT